MNTADAEALMGLPGIGPGFANKIIEYRTKYGPFQRPQDLIIINGFGERRYYRIEPYVCAY
jgi:competence protein ComEA